MGPRIEKLVFINSWRKLSDPLSLPTNSFLDFHFLYILQGQDRKTYKISHFSVIFHSPALLGLRLSIAEP